MRITGRQRVVKESRVDYFVDRVAEIRRESGELC
jgi:hypothetical protein